MVYSVRSNRPIVSVKPLKTKRVKSEREKSIDEFMQNHRVSVQTDSTGKIDVNISEG